MSDNSEFYEQLDAALETRPVIEQAKGVLVSARSMSPEQAFSELRFVSMQHNVKLNELAAALVAVVGAHQEVDPCLRKVIGHEWGGIVPNC
jgi:AmiR/NasT family two-component response regulator